MGLPQRDNEHHTYGDYLTWPDDARYALIGALAYRMAPAPTLEYQEIAGEIFRQLANALQGFAGTRCSRACRRRRSDWRAPRRLRDARAWQDAPPCLKRLRQAAKRKPRFGFASQEMPWQAFFEVPSSNRGAKCLKSSRVERRVSQAQGGLRPAGNRHRLENPRPVQKRPYEMQPEGLAAVVVSLPCR